jgi:hypothetical protein
MQTSGSGKDLWMTAVPVACLALFILVAFGGPKPFLAALEDILRVPFEWVTNLTR